MAYVMLLNLRIILFFIYSVIERFKKVFIHRFTMGSIVVYRTTIIANTLNEVANCMKLRVVKSWLT